MGKRMDLAIKFCCSWQISTFEPQSWQLLRLGQCFPIGISSCYISIDRQYVLTQSKEGRIQVPKDFYSPPTIKKENCLNECQRMQVKEEPYRLFTFDLMLFYRYKV